MEVLEFQLGIPFFDLNEFKIDPDVLKIVPFQLVKRHNILPVKLEMNMLYVAMEDPFNFIAVEDIKMATNLEVVPVISFKKAIISAIDKIFGTEAADKAIKDFQ
ncbi:MAG TPA: type II secretion system protein GspE, partial [Clostridiales bacterium]|nr:type II secretion system protein GspE [Clostridiales bacterium]